MITKWMESLEIKDVDESRRRIRFRATKFEVDRDGDRVWTTENKRGKGLIVSRGDKTPLKVFHDYHSYPVGFARDWDLNKGHGDFTGDFFPAEIVVVGGSTIIVGEERELAFNTSLKGVMCCSIGFQDLIKGERELTEEEVKQSGEGRRIRQGWDFFESELVEVSLTDVPSNRGAVRLDMDLQDMVKKTLADIIQAGGGCARKGCSSSKPDHQGPISLASRVDQFEMELIKAMNAGDLSLDRSKIESIMGHLQDYDTLLWYKQPESNDLLANVQSEIDKILDTVTTKPGFEETENEIRYRIREPGDFQDNSFRRITLQKDKPRVYGITGRLKGEDKTTLQALRFPKEDEWDVPKARAWVKDHPDIKKDLSAELLQTAIMEG